MQIQVSIIVPVFNEAGNLSPLVAEIRQAMETTSRDWELLLVDDKSTDRSLDECRRLAAVDPRIRVLEHRRNAGQSAAMATGFRHVRGEWVVTLDADMQNDPADIPRLLAETGEFDLVSGIRTNRRDDWVRRWSSRIANAVRRRVLGDTITDVGCSLKVYRARDVRAVPVFNGMHRFLPALLQHRGARVKEMSVNHRPRLHGKAKYGVGNRLWRGIADVLAVRWLQSRFIDPDNVVEERGTAESSEERQTAGSGRGV